MYGVLFTVACVEPSWFKPWSLAWFLSIFNPTWAALIWLLDGLLIWLGSRSFRHSRLMGA
jgi:hypothetical protein